MAKKCLRIHDVTDTLRRVWRHNKIGFFIFFIWATPIALLVAGVHELEHKFCKEVHNG